MMMDEDGLTPNHPFDVEMVPGYHDGDFPDWPEHIMWRSVPDEILELGKVEDSVLNGAFLTLHANSLHEVIAVLEGLGHICTVDQDLIGKFWEPEATEAENEETFEDLMPSPKL